MESGMGSEEDDVLHELVVEGGLRRGGEEVEEGESWWEGGGEKGGLVLVMGSGKVVAGWVQVNWYLVPGACQSLSSVLSLLSSILSPHSYLPNTHIHLLNNPLNYVLSRPKNKQSSDNKQGPPANA